MMIAIDISDLNLRDNTLFHRLEPIVMYGAVDFCGSYVQSTLMDFHTEMIEFLFNIDSDADDEIDNLISDLEASEFDELVNIAFAIYQKVIVYFKHLWGYEELRDAILVNYQGNRDYQTIYVEVELDAPEEVIATAKHHKQMELRRIYSKPNLFPIIEGNI